MEIAFILFFGLVLGSFASALSWRVPRGIPWVTAPKGDQGTYARSACPHCNKTLQIQDLVPFFSWIFLKGKCRYCGHEIGWRYPLTELATLLGCIGVYLVWGFTVPAFIIMAAVPLLVALWVIDLEHMILPNQLVFLAAVLAAFLILYQWVAYGFDYGFGGQALFKLAGLVVYPALVWLAGILVGFFLKKEALGMGDVKFFAMAGLWLGLPMLPFFLVCAGLCGVAMGVFYHLFLKKRLFPFGPALIMALYAGLLLQGLEIIPLIGVQ